MTTTYGVGPVYTRNGLYPSPKTGAKLAEEKTETVLVAEAPPNDLVKKTDQDPHLTRLISTYKKTLAVVLSKKGLLERANNGYVNGLNEKDKESVAAFKKARNQLINYAFTLYRKRFINSPGDVEAISKWGHLVREMNKMRPPSMVKKLLKIVDPGFSKSDCEYLLALFFGKVTLPATREMYLGHLRQSKMDYNGWQGENYRSASRKIVDFIEEKISEIVPYNYNEYENGGVIEHHWLVRELLGGRYDEALAVMDYKAAKKYEKMDGVELFLTYKAVKNIAEEAMIGSAQKIYFHRLTSDLRTIITARGNDFAEYQQFIIREALPDLTKTEYKMLKELNQAAGEAEAKNVLQDKNKFMPVYRHFLLAYGKASLSMKHVYAGAIEALYNYGKYFGLSRTYLEKYADDLFTRLGKGVPAGPGFKNMAELGRANLTEISPAGLPQEVKDILVKTKYWELVSKNVVIIALTPSIKKYGGLFQPGGVAQSSIKRVTLAFCAEEGKPISSWAVARILAHEAAHLEWRNKPEAVMNGLAHERNAYLIEYKFFLAYLDSPELYLPTNDKEIDRFQGLLCTSRNAVESANYIFGYGRTDFTLNKIEPPKEEYCQSRGGNNCLELETGYYPNNTPPGFLESYDHYEKLLGNQKLDHKTKDLIWEILGGQMLVRISQKVDRHSFPVITVEKNGEERRLNMNVAQQVVNTLNFLARKSAAEIKEDQFGILIDNLDFLTENKVQIDRDELINVLNEELDYKKITKWVMSLGVDYNPLARLDKIKEEMAAFLPVLIKVLKGSSMYAKIDDRALITAFKDAARMVKNPSLVNEYAERLKSKTGGWGERQELKLAFSLYQQLNKMGFAQEQKIEVLDFTRGQIIFSSLMSEVSTVSLLSPSGIKFDIFRGSCRR